MYDLTWRNEQRWRAATKDRPIAVAPPDHPVTHAGLLLWEEHCVECSIPDCYTSCPLYVARRDQKCARFAYGIFPNRDVAGPLGYAADVYFRRWGKLEARWNGIPRMDELSTVRRVADWDCRIGSGVNALGTLLQRIDPKRRVNGAYALARSRWQERRLQRQAGDSSTPDALYLKFYSDGPEELDVQIEVHQDRPVFRTNVRAAPGWNEKIIPFSDLHIEDGRSGRILIELPSEREARLVFTWLDLVRFARVVAPQARFAPAITERQHEAKKPATRSKAAPAAKVKCVVWDLDNTLWSGVIGDDGPDGVKPNRAALDVVHALDERGIVQSIASKNEYQLAWSRIESLGLADYFLYPAIHWGAKSGSIRAIAEELNIGVDTLAFIDDSPFERSEVQASFGEVRVYDVSEIENLLERREFDVPITEASRLRRQSYLAEAQRKQAARVWRDDEDSFLRSCGLVLRISSPEEADYARCLELIQRTNQLNLSTRRFDRSAFEALVSDPSIDCYVLRCEDRFGDYGLVGFAAFDSSGFVPRLSDFVLSCRVAQKRVEETFFKWYMRKAQARGADRIQATFVASARNAPLREALATVPFVPAAAPDSDACQLLEYVPGSDVEPSDIVRIMDLAEAT
jgi:FkbH-like protein